MKLDAAISKIKMEILNLESELALKREFLKTLISISLEEYASEVENKSKDEDNKPTITYESVDQVDVKKRSVGRILALFKNNPDRYYSPKSIRLLTKFHQSTVYNALRELVRGDLVQHKDKGTYQYNALELKLVESDKHGIIHQED